MAMQYRDEFKPLIEKYLPVGFDAAEVLVQLAAADPDSTASWNPGWRSFRRALSALEAWLRPHGGDARRARDAGAAPPEFPPRSVVGAIWVLEGARQEAVCFSPHMQRALDAIGLGAMRLEDGARNYDADVWPPDILYRLDPAALSPADWKDRFARDGWSWDAIQDAMLMLPPSDVSADRIRIDPNVCAQRPNRKKPAPALSPPDHPAPPVQAVKRSFYRSRNRTANAGNRKSTRTPSRARARTRPRRRIPVAPDNPEGSSRGSSENGSSDDNSTNANPDQMEAAVAKLRNVIMTVSRQLSLATETLETFPQAMAAFQAAAAAQAPVSRAVGSAAMQSQIGDLIAEQQRLRANLEQHRASTASRFDRVADEHESLSEFVGAHCDSITARMSELEGVCVGKSEDDDLQGTRWPSSFESRITEIEKMLS